MNPYHFGHYNHNHGGYPYNHHHVHPHDHWFHDPLWPVMIYPFHNHPPYIDCMDHHVALFSTVGRGLTGEKGEKGDQGDQGIQGPEGPQGQDGPAGYGFHSHWEGTKLVIENEDGTEQDPVDLKGTAGDPGISVTHEWDGTTLIINSASGTSSADLKGDDGDFQNLTEEEQDEIADYIAEKIISGSLDQLEYTFVSSAHLIPMEGYQWHCVDVNKDDFDSFVLNYFDVNRIPIFGNGISVSGIADDFYNSAIQSPEDMNIKIYMNGLYMDCLDGLYAERPEGDPSYCDWSLETRDECLFIHFFFPVESAGEILKIVFTKAKWDTTS